MIIVRVELHSAITHKVTELARMEIINDGSSIKPSVGNYMVQTLRGRSKADLDMRNVQRVSNVINHPRLQQHVWNLVAKALTAMRYGI